MKRFSLCLLTITIIVASSAFAVQVDTAETTSLAMAVMEFNAKTRNHSIGKSQLPLTDDEVVAAIRGWIPKQTPGVTDEIYKQIQEVAESRELPKNTSLSFCSGWTGYRGYAFKVWWVDLTIMNSDKTGYTFRIRDQKISSRKMTQAELAEMKKTDGPIN